MDDSRIEHAAREILRSRGSRLIASDERWPGALAASRKNAAKPEVGDQIVSAAMRDAAAALVTGAPIPDGSKLTPAEEKWRRIGGVVTALAALPRADRLEAMGYFCPRCGDDDEACDCPA